MAEETKKIDRRCCVCGAEPSQVCVVRSGDRSGDSRLDGAGNHDPHFYR